MGFLADIIADATLPRRYGGGLQLFASSATVHADEPLLKPAASTKSGGCITDQTSVDVNIAASSSRLDLANIGKRQTDDTTASASPVVPGIESPAGAASALTPLLTEMETGAREVPTDETEKNTVPTKPASDAFDGKVALRVDGCLIDTEMPRLGGASTGFRGTTSAAVEPHKTYGADCDSVEITKLCDGDQSVVGAASAGHWSLTDGKTVRSRAERLLGTPLPATSEDVATGSPGFVRAGSHVKTDFEGESVILPRPTTFERAFHSKSIDSSVERAGMGESTMSAIGGENETAGASLDGSTSAERRPQTASDTGSAEQHRMAPRSIRPSTTIGDADIRVSAQPHLGLTARATKAPHYGGGPAAESRAGAEPETPRVHIGQIDVFVEAPEPEPHRTDAPTTSRPATFASSLFLRRA